VESQEAALVQELRVGNSEPGDVRRHEAAAAEPRRALVREQDERNRQHRVEPVVLEVQPIDQGHDAARQQPACHESNAHLDDEEPDEIHHTVGRALDEGDHAHREEDRRRIVAAGLELQQMAQARDDGHPATGESRRPRRRPSRR
jgi:hypothetical protein